MSSASRGLAPREGLDSLLMKMGRTGLLAKPRRGPQAGKSGDPRSQNTDNIQTITDFIHRRSTMTLGCSERDA